MKEQKEKKQPAIVLEFEDFIIESVPNNYILRHGNSETFYPTIEQAIAKISAIILKEKFASRKFQEGRKDMKQLSDTVNAHHEWFVGMCKGY